MPKYRLSTLRNDLDASPHAAKSLAAYKAWAAQVRREDISANRKGAEKVVWLAACAYTRQMLAPRPLGDKIKIIRSDGSSSEVSNQMFRDLLATATDNPHSHGFATYLDSGDIVIAACRPIQRLPLHFAKAVHTHLGLTIQAAEDEAQQIQEP